MHKEALQCGVNDEKVRILHGFFLNEAQKLKVKKSKGPWRKTKMRE